DGKDDLVFTNPDYFCVASGPTGEPLLGPDFPPKIFNQPSQGLYTLPALLANAAGDPTVCLTNGHYFQGVMSLREKPLWYRLPEGGGSCRRGRRRQVRDPGYNRRRLRLPPGRPEERKGTGQPVGLPGEELTTEDTACPPRTGQGA